MRDVMDRFEALYIRLVEAEAELHAATEVLGRVHFEHSRIDHREIDRLDHFLHAAHGTVIAILDEFKMTLRAAMKVRSFR